MAYSLYCVPWTLRHRGRGSTNNPASGICRLLLGVTWDQPSLPGSSSRRGGVGVMVPSVDGEGEVPSSLPGPQQVCETMACWALLRCFPEGPDT